VAQSAAEINGKGAATPPNQMAQMGANVNDDLIYRAYYNLKQPTVIIGAEIETYFRSHSMEYTMDEMFAARDVLTKSICDELNAKMNPYGYVVQRVMVTDIDPDATVVAAMNNIQAAKKQRDATVINAEAARQAAILKGEADRQAAILKGESDKATMIAKAEGEARARELEGAGTAAQRARLVAGLKESVADFKSAVPEASALQLMSIILTQQYLDIMKEAASNGRNTFILPSNPAEVQSVEGRIGMAILGTKGAVAQEYVRQT
jgi:regulator of protease activity HflC (stomatin/prohibitin superfamily)